MISPKKAFLTIAAVFISAFFFFSQTHSALAGVTPTTPAPTFSPPAGDASSTTPISLSASGAEHIYYTLDGSAPNASSSDFMVTGPFTLGASFPVTVRAYATRLGYFDSSEASSTYINEFDGGSGTAILPYRIATCTQLTHINDFLGSYYVLENDLDCTSLGNDVLIGSDDGPFTGQLDGQNHAISANLTFNLDNHTGGVFRKIDGGTLTNLRQRINIASFDNTYLPSVMVTNGTAKIGTFPIGITNLANTSWRIDTSVTDSATVGAIRQDFAGPATSTLTGEFPSCSTEHDSSQWCVLYNGSTDDGSVMAPFPESFTTFFNNQVYSDGVYIGSNTYFTFGQGSSVYSNIAANNPAIPGVHVCAYDNSYQRVFYRYDDPNTLRVRYEGTNSTWGTSGNPKMVYEAIFHNGQRYLDLYVGRNDRCTAGIKPITLPSFVGVGYELSVSLADWTDTATPAMAYQWQFSDSNDPEGTWNDIPSANSLSFTPTASQLGKYLRLNVTATQNGEAITVHSDPSEQVINVPILTDSDHNGFYEISTCEELQAMRYSLARKYELKTDVDCSMTNPDSPNYDSEGTWGDGYGFKPVGDTTNRFTGILRGNGHTISSLYIDLSESNYVGLFSVIDQTGQVYDLNLTNAYITGNNEVGGLVGGLSGTVTNVQVNGQVHGNTEVGGLVGQHIAPSGIGSSSPLLFTWNGSKYKYLADLGRSLPRNTTGDDTAQIDTHDLVPLDNRYSMKISEEYNEIVYYDELALTTFDHAPGYRVLTSLARNARNSYYTVSRNPSHPLVACTDMYGHDCLNDLKASDDKWSYKDKSNLNYWTMDFGDLSGAAQIKLIIQGARDYSLTSDDLRYIQVQNASGKWVNAYAKADISAPPGSPRFYAVDMTGKFIGHNYKVRVAFDRTRMNYFAIDTSDPVPYTSHTYHPTSAYLDFHGFTAVDKTYFWDHDWSKVSPTPDDLFAAQIGNFTKYGDVTPLLNATDDQFVVMHYGDAMDVSFDYVPPAAGQERDFMLYNWVTYKHAKTEDGQTVDPLPFNGMTAYPYVAPQAYPMTAANQTYLQTWNTRTVTGDITTHSSTVIDSSSRVAVTGWGDVGGLVGYNDKTIRNSYATGSVDGCYDVGGLVGYHDQDGIVEYSHATGDVSNLCGSSGYGGLIGSVSMGSVSSSYATGNVTGYERVGGLIGDLYMARIANVYSTGDVLGLNSSVGGLIGFDYVTGPVSIINAYSTGNATGTELVGGLIGYNDGDDVSHSFSVGSANGDSPTNGLIGNDATANPSLYTDNYWYGDLGSGIGNLPVPTSSGAWEKVTTTDVFKGNSTNAPFAGHWDFTSNSPVWFTAAGQYPQLTPLQTTYFELNYTANAGGSINGSTRQHVYFGMDGTAVTAVAASGYRFVRWSDGITTNPRIDQNVTDDVNISAVFESSGGNGGGGYIPPGSSGSGGYNVSAYYNPNPIGTTLEVGAVDRSGVNVLTYVTNLNYFLAGESSQHWALVRHSFKITDLDLGTGIATIVFASNPQTIKLKKGESKQIDLDGDGTDDILATFSDLLVNRAEITLKSLAPTFTSGTQNSTNPPAKTAKFAFKRTLKLGMKGDDVKQLQILLNRLGFKIAGKGAGSPGKETTLFGAGTKNALIKFQKKYKLKPLTGILGPSSRNLMNTML